MLQLDSQLGYGRLGLPQDILRLEYVAFAGTTALILCLSDAERLLLFNNIGAGDGDQPFRGANTDIGSRYITQKRNQNAVVGRDRCKICPVSGFDPAAELAPEVQLPSRLRANRVGPEVGRRRITDRPAVWRRCSDC